MNCCDSYGRCTQGPDCAARTSMEQGCAPEGGNVWFVGSEPDLIEPLSGWSMALVWGCILIVGAVSAALLVAGAIYFYQLFF